MAKSMKLGGGREEATVMDSSGVGIVKLDVDALRIAIGLPDGYEILDPVEVCTVWKKHIGLMVTGPEMPHVPDGEQVPIVELKLSSKGEVCHVQVAADQEMDDNNAWHKRHPYKCRHLDCNNEKYSLVKR